MRITCYVNASFCNGQSTKDALSVKAEIVIYISNKGTKRWKGGRA